VIRWTRAPFKAGLAMPLTRPLSTRCHPNPFGARGVSTDGRFAVPQQRMAHNRGLSWSAENPGGQSPGSAPAFFPGAIERQGAAPSTGGAPGFIIPTSDDFAGTSNQPHHRHGHHHGQHHRHGSGGGVPQAVGLDMSNRRTNSDISDSAAADPTAIRFGDPRDDLPLLEELGIYPSHILKKSLAVLHPFRTMAIETVEDSDVAGPLVFTQLLGFMLTLQGKLHFGAIYGLSMLGILLSQCLLSLMSDEPVQLQLVISTLGYCLLPNAVLAVFSTRHYWFVGRSAGIVLPLALAIIAWSAWCATSMFTQAFRLQHCRFLILYPATLFYAVFAALTIF
jgi:hypothetical protein